jgi:hypothetical protein
MVHAAFHSSGWVPGVMAWPLRLSCNAGGWARDRADPQAELALLPPSVIRPVDGERVVIRGTASLTGASDGTWEGVG